GGPGLQGSTRFIKVFKGDFCQAFDLYDYYSTGKDATSLLAGAETLVVEKKSAMVRISGAVNRPAIFELLPQEMMAAKILEMAGGLISEAGVQIKFDIYRKAGDSVRHFISREMPRSELLSGLAAIKLQDEDRLYFKAVADSDLPVKIELKGAFRFPGKLVVKDTARLGDVITLESLLPGFAGEYAELLRVSPQSEEYELISFSIDRLLSGEAFADFELQNGDRIVVFSKEDFSRTAKVAIEQDLHGKQIFLWRPGLRLSEMVQMAGGLERDASFVGELIRKKITEAGVETSTTIVDLRKLWSNDDRYDLELQPYDLLLIKGKR
ncbi:MAG: SLBB domain-containing protein, partial [Candidatus Rifleibacteriota bacterium]